MKYYTKNKLTKEDIKNIITEMESKKIKITKTEFEKNILIILIFVFLNLSVKDKIKIREIAQKLISFSRTRKHGLGKDLFSILLDLSEVEDSSGITLEKIKNDFFEYLYNNNLTDDFLLNQIN